jgi:small subunit ribosomal protein S1
VVTKNHHPSRSQDEMGPMDDTWWSALLAEEERYTAAASKPGIQPSASNSVAVPVREKVRKSASTRQVKASGKVNWLRAQAIYVRDEVVRLRVSGTNRGGLLVAGNDVHGFVPVSHLVDIDTEIPDVEREQLLETYVGQLLPVKIIECDPERGRLIFSQRAAMAGDGQRNLLLDQLQEGVRIRGLVTNITNFGAFVDLGGIEGLIHISELSWGRVQHPDETIRVGDEVETVVLSLDRDNCRVALSLKRLFPNPWETAAERYFPGLVVEATITSVVPFGAFARVEEGLDGLIHASGMQLAQVDGNPADLLRIGQQVKVRVLHVDAKRQRLGLSLCDEIEM